MKGAIARSILLLPKERLAKLVGLDVAELDVDWLDDGIQGPAIDLDLERGVFTVEGHFQGLGAFVAGTVNRDGARFTNGGYGAYETAPDYYVLANRIQDEAVIAAQTLDNTASPDVIAPEGWGYRPDQEECHGHRHTSATAETHRHR